MMHDWGYSNGYDISGFVCMFSLVGLVVVGVWLVVRRHGQGHGFVGASETALDVLKKRYAKGEVTKNEFEQIRKDLQ
jgi:putative membrane protein